MPITRNPSAPTHQLPGTQFTSLATPSRGTRSTSVWRVELQPGTPARPHELTAEEVFVVLSGRAQVRIGDEQSEVGPGDCMIVPPDTLFSLEAVGDRAFAALCCFPVGGRGRLADGNEFTPPWAE